MTGSSRDASVDVDFEAGLTLQRLKPRLAEVWQAGDDDAAHQFDLRLDEHWPTLFALLFFHP